MITDGNPITSVNRDDERRPPPPLPPPGHLRGLRTPPLDRPFTFAPRLPLLTPRASQSVPAWGLGRKALLAPHAQPLGAISIPSLSTVPSFTISSSPLSPSSCLCPCICPQPCLCPYPLGCFFTGSLLPLASLFCPGVFSCQLLLCTEAVAEVAV